MRNRGLCGQSDVGFAQSDFDEFPIIGTIPMEQNFVSIVSGDFEDFEIVYDV